MLTEVLTTRQRVTQTDVARVAGVHNTTVSLCLRNCPSIPEATRLRIRKIAADMGYYPDPTLRALVAYRKGQTSNLPKATLAYITNWNTRWGWRDVPSYERAYLGAQRKAAELGYQLEHFWLGEPGMNQRRMSSMLYHRGITGVLIAAHGESSDELKEIDWSRLSAVKIGCFPHAPALHRVIDDHSSMVRLAMRRIQNSGYERIGLVMAQGWDDLSDRAWSSGYLTEQYSLPANQQIPIFRFADSRLDCVPDRTAQRCASELTALSRWYQDYRPEVVLGFNPTVLGQLELLGLSVPRNVAYVDLSLESIDANVAGVRQNSEISGEVATTILVGQMQQNLCGIPTVATTTLVDGTWIDGNSLPRVPESRRSSQKFKARADFVEAALLASA